MEQPHESWRRSVSLPTCCTFQWWRNSSESPFRNSENKTLFFFNQLPLRCICSVPSGLEQWDTNSVVPIQHSKTLLWCSFALLKTRMCGSATLSGVHCSAWVGWSPIFRLLGKNGVFLGTEITEKSFLWFSPLEMSAACLVMQLSRRDHRSQPQHTSLTDTGGFPNDLFLGIVARYQRNGNIT